MAASASSPDINSKENTFKCTCTPLSKKFSINEKICDSNVIHSVVKEFESTPLGHLGKVPLEIRRAIYKKLIFHHHHINSLLDGSRCKHIYGLFKASTVVRAECLDILHNECSFGANIEDLSSKKLQNSGALNAITEIHLFMKPSETSENMMGKGSLHLKGLSEMHLIGLHPFLGREKLRRLFSFRIQLPGLDIERQERFLKSVPFVATALRRLNGFDHVRIRIEEWWLQHREESDAPCSNREFLVSAARLFSTELKGSLGPCQYRIEKPTRNHRIVLDVYPEKFFQSVLRIIAGLEN